MKKIIVLMLLFTVLTGCSIKATSFKDTNLRLGIDKELNSQGLSFSDLDDVTSLNLSYLNIENLEGIEQLTNLKTLNLSNNNLSSIKALSALSNLKILDLQNNMVKDISPLKSLDNLEVLLIRNNLIEDMSVLSSQYDSYLRTDFLVKVVFEDRLLETIIRNKINKKDGIITVNDLRKIKALDLSNKNITDLSGTEYLLNLEEFHINAEAKNMDLLKNLKKLRKLTLKNCELQNIDFLENLIMIEEIDLSNNNIVNIQVFENFKRLKSVHLENNKINDIEPLKGHSQIRTLFLSRNYIEDYDILGELIDDIIDTDIKLYFFYDDILDKLVREATGKINGILTFKDIEGLKFLDASSLGIENLGGIELMTGLVSLDLNNNDIDSIDELDKLTNLEVLKINNNLLVDVTALYYLDKLKILDLSHNDIRTIEPLLDLSNLEYLYLAGNNFIIDESVERFKQSLKGVDDW